MADSSPFTHVTGNTRLVRRLVGRRGVGAENGGMRDDERPSYRGLAWRAAPERGRKSLAFSLIDGSLEGLAMGGVGRR